LQKDGVNNERELVAKVTVKAITRELSERYKKAILQRLPWDAISKFN
jgi:hypothetical protein